MSDHEVPFIGGDRFDQLDERLDHAVVCQYVTQRFLGGNDAATAMNSLFRKQYRSDTELFDKLQEVGRCVEPIDEYAGVDPETPALKAFLAGTTVALEALHTIAYELQITPEKIKEHWKEKTRFLYIVQPPKEADLSPSELYAAVGQGIMERGQRELHALPNPYKELIDAIDGTNVISYTHSNVFKASFGYILTACMRATNHLLVEDEVAAINSKKLDWDTWLSDIQKLD